MQYYDICATGGSTDRHEQAGSPSTEEAFIVAALLLVTSTVSLVVTESPWYVLYLLTPALVLIGRWYWPQCIRRRIKLLSERANVN